MIKNSATITFRKKWVEALRSGDYKQGCNFYYNEMNDRYCCLGVANAISGEYMGVGGKLMVYGQVTHQLGLTMGEKSRLSHINDRELLLFPQIAKLIEMMEDDEIDINLMDVDEIVNQVNSKK